jgi:hypothetical protein
MNAGQAGVRRAAPRPGGEAVTMRRFLERVNDDELDRLRGAVPGAARGGLP